MQRVADQAAPAASLNLGAVVVSLLFRLRSDCLPVCPSIRPSVCLAICSSVCSSASLSLSLCLSTRLCLCHFQLKCRPRPIKFLAKFIRDFCPRCRCLCRTRTIALYTIINGNFCWFLLVSNIICYFCLLFSMFTALPFRQLPPIWMPSRRSPMRPPIPEVSSKVVNIKKKHETKRNSPAASSP